MVECAVENCSNVGIIKVTCRPIEIPNHGCITPELHICFKCRDSMLDVKPFSISDRIQDDIAKEEIDKINQVTIKSNKMYERYEDMSSDGRLSILQQDSGDIIISIEPSKEDAHYHYPSIEFCTCSNGGGQSPTVLEALYELMKAIEMDNQFYPQDKDHS